MQKIILIGLVLCCATVVRAEIYAGTIYVTADTVWGTNGVGSATSNFYYNSGYIDIPVATMEGFSYRLRGNHYDSEGTLIKSSQMAYNNIGTAINLGTVDGRIVRLVISEKTLPATGHYYYEVISGSPELSTEVVDWTGHVFYNDTLKDAWFKLQANIDGVWTTVQDLLCAGKETWLEPAMPYEFGEVEVPEGVEWRIQATPVEFDNPSGDEVDQWGNPRGNVTGFNVMGVTQTSGQIFHTDDNSSLTVLPDTIDLDSGFSNVQTTNENVIASAEVASGIKLAQQYIENAGRNAIDNSELAEFLRSNVDFYGVNNGITAVNDSVNGVAMIASDANDNLLAIYNSMNDGISVHDGGNGEYNSETNHFEGKINEIETQEGNLASFVDGLKNAFVVPAITPVYSVQFNLGGRANTMDFSNPMYDTIHGLLEWMVHLFMLFAIIGIIRSAIA